MPKDPMPQHDPVIDGTVSRRDTEPHTGTTVAASSPSWEHPPWQTRRGPNVVFIVLDDVGYAQLGCYGSAINTPAIDSLARAGQRYRNFHVTGLCSTTRACLLTGRNHHSVGMGFLADFDTGYPSYRGEITHKAATLAEMLRNAGYATYAVGKWHLTPRVQISPAGPFDQWPTGRGFDRYYGFLWGEEDQWAPELWYDQHRVDPPRRHGYHLSEDIVDHAQAFLADHQAAAPERPFLLYVAFGACHAPHHAPRKHIDKYRGRFDHGWDAERERILARQIELGVVPQGTELPPRNPGVVTWKELDAERRRLYCRMQETFAGFMDHTDTQISRLIEWLRSDDLLDDTIIVLLSDNGASGEGGEHGSWNEYRYFLGLPDSLERNLAAYEQLGGPHTHNHYPSGWAQAGNTPLKLYKKYTFGGGVRAPLIVHWPAALRSPGRVREEFCHAVDITPTILDLLDVQAPATYAGHSQMPLHGTSMAHTITGASVLETKPRAQYFETGGHRGIYCDGWKAVINHHSGVPFDDDRWELYHLPTDFAELHDRADGQPERLQAMIDLWDEHARRYGVLPLDDRGSERAYALDPSAQARQYFKLRRGVNLLGGVVGPDFSGRSWSIKAHVEHQPGDQGVLVAHGRRAAGFSLFIQQDRLQFDYNCAGDHTLLSSPDVLQPGTRLLEADLRLTGGDSASVTLRVDGQTVAEGPVERTLPAGFGFLTTEVGRNSPSPVSECYQSPFDYTGGLDMAIVHLGELPLTDQSIELKAALARE